jgi:hypothetical protein
MLHKASPSGWQLILHVKVLRKLTAAWKRAAIRFCKYVIEFYERDS